MCIFHQRKNIRWTERYLTLIPKVPKSVMLKSMFSNFSAVINENCCLFFGGQNLKHTQVQRPICFSRHVVFQFGPGSVQCLIIKQKVIIPRSFCATNNCIIRIKSFLSSKYNRKENLLVVIKETLLNSLG